MKEQIEPERIAKIMPTFTFWGEGIVVVNRKQWQKAENRIRAILKQLYRAKERSIKRQIT